MLTRVVTAIVSSSGDFASFYGRSGGSPDLFFRPSCAARGAPKPADDALLEAVAQRFAGSRRCLPPSFTLDPHRVCLDRGKVVVLLRTPAAALAHIPAMQMPRSALLDARWLFGAQLTRRRLCRRARACARGATLMAFGLQGLAGLHEVTLGAAVAPRCEIASLLLVLSQGMLFIALILSALPRPCSASRP